MNILPNSAGGQEGDVGGGGEQLRRAALEPPDPRRGAPVPVSGLGVWTVLGEFSL